MKKWSESKCAFTIYATVFDELMFDNHAHCNITCIVCNARLLHLYINKKVLNAF